MAIDLEKLRPTDLTSNLNLTSFDCGNYDLNDFIKNNALDYQKQHIAQTTCILYGGEIVAYYTLACDALYLLNKEKRKSGIPFIKGQYDTYPAIKICRMACINNYKRNRIESLLIKLIIGKVYTLNSENRIACRFITVDAYPGAQKFYEKQGFVYNLHPNYLIKTRHSLIDRARKALAKLKGNEVALRPISMRLNIFKD